MEKNLLISGLNRKEINIFNKYIFFWPKFNIKTDFKIDFQDESFILKSVFILKGRLHRTNLETESRLDKVTTALNSV